MVPSLDPQWLQGYFSTLAGLFDRVGLKTNVDKTVGMVCCTCQAAGTQSKAEYRRSITRAGPSYQERQRGRIQCKDFSEEMVLGLLSGHIQTQHGRAEKGIRRWEATSPGKEPRTYRMEFLTAGGAE